jgi:hypothetical protein
MTSMPPCRPTGVPSAAGRLASRSSFAGEARCVSSSLPRMTRSGEPDSGASKASPADPRDRDLQALARTRASVVLVTGDAGIGKTTLLDRLPTFLPDALVAERKLLYGTEPLSNAVLALGFEDGREHTRPRLRASPAFRA